jgi:hypothetical protein
VIEWHEAIERATAAAREAERVVAEREYVRAQTYAQISYAWSNLAMMVEAQEAAEAEASDAAT